MASKKGKKLLVGAGVSSTLLKFRTGYDGGVPGYFMLRREVAAAVARFRIGYGPDAVLLRKRGLYVSGVGLESLNS